MRDNRRFKIPLIVLRPMFQTKEFQHHWLFEYLLRFFGHPFFSCDCQNGLFIITHQKSLIEHRVYLPF